MDDPLSLIPVTVCVDPSLKRSVTSLFALFLPRLTYSIVLITVEWSKTSSIHEPVACPVVAQPLVSVPSKTFSQAQSGLKNELVVQDVIVATCTTLVPVGAELGDAVGLSVGEEVGKSVGLVVGALVGVPVGAALGASVGESVGA